MDHPEWQDFDAPTPADGRSTAGVSGAATPMQGPNGGTKLKLTFNGNREEFSNGDGGGMSDED